MQTLVEYKNIFKSLFDDKRGYKHGPELAEMCDDFFNRNSEKLPVDERVFTGASYVFKFLIAVNNPNVRRMLKIKANCLPKELFDAMQKWVIKQDGCTGYNPPDKSCSYATFYTSKYPQGCCLPDAFDSLLKSKNEKKWREIHGYPSA